MSEFDAASLPTLQTQYYGTQVTEWRLTDFLIR
jgi:hypothetical protein